MRPDGSGDIILVGAARSGTTLACALLNDSAVRNMVALDEPYSRDQIAAVEPEDFVSFVAAQFAQFRQTILETGETVSTVGEEGLGNHYSRGPSNVGLRERIVSPGQIQVTKPIDRDFRLAVKHTIPFTGMLDHIRDRYQTYAIVRNPLAILASWNSIDASYRNGLPPAYAAHLCGDMPRLINAVRDRFERQVVLLSWHFERYLPLLLEGNVVRYEDIVASGGRALDIVSGDARQLARPLSNHNRHR